METSEKYYLVVENEEVIAESVYPFIYDNENGKTCLRIVVSGNNADYGKLEKMLKYAPSIEVFMTETNAEGEETPRLKIGQYNNFCKNFSCSFNSSEHPNCYFIELDRYSDAEMRIEELKAELDFAQQTILMGL